MQNAFDKLLIIIVGVWIVEIVGKSSISLTNRICASACTNESMNLRPLIDKRYI